MKKSPVTSFTFHGTRALYPVTIRQAMSQIIKSRNYLNGGVNIINIPRTFNN